MPKIFADDRRREALRIEEVRARTEQLRAWRAAQGSARVCRRNYRIVKIVPGAIDERNDKRATIPASRVGGDAHENRRACMRALLAALLLIVGTIPAGAQWVDYRTPGIPRKSDGKPDLTAPTPRGPDGKPDLTGVWNGPVPDTDFDAANAQPWV
jgi:hypothetical protein